MDESSVKLVIQIPCLNEEQNLPQTVAELPRELQGVDEVEWLVVDDGSTDRTAEVARELGVETVISHIHNRGLAAAFQTGLDACLARGADIIVNTDADNQYPGRFIPDLVRPILDGEADLVIGDRQTDRIPHFSRSKKFLQRLGSATVRLVSGTKVPDAPSGFRALSRSAAMRINIFDSYTYTLDTIIQAGKKELTIVSVPVEPNPTERESRLMQHVAQYVFRSTLTILRLFVIYEPLRTFSLISAPFFLTGIVLWARYLVLMFQGLAGPGTHVQSVVVGGAALIVGFLVFLIGVVADLVGTSRRLHEDSLFYLKTMLYSEDGREPGNRGQGPSNPR